VLGVSRADEDFGKGVGSCPHPRDPAALQSSIVRRSQQPQVGRCGTEIYWQKRSSSLNWSRARGGTWNHNVSLLTTADP